MIITFDAYEANPDFQEKSKIVWDPLSNVARLGTWAHFSSQQKLSHTTIHPIVAAAECKPTDREACARQLASDIGSAIQHRVALGLWDDDSVIIGLALVGKDLTMWVGSTTKVDDRFFNGLPVPVDRLADHLKYDIV